MAVKAVDVPAFRKRQKEARAKGRYLGIGFATFSERTGYGSPAFAARGMEITPGWETVDRHGRPSGFVEARIGSSPHGQGLRTTLAQIIADEIGVTPDMIKVVHGDTDRAPYGWGTFASRSLVISGGATLIAARKVRAKLIKIASHLLEAAPGDIVLADGVAKVAGTDRAIADSQAGTRGLHANASFQGRDRARPHRDAVTRSARHVLQCLPHRHRRGRRRDRPRKGRAIPGGGGCRPHHQSDDSRRSGPWRHRPGHRQRAARGDHLRRDWRHSHRDAGRLSAAYRARDPADRIASHRNAERRNSITKAKGLGEGGAIGAPAAVVNAINDALSPFGVEIDEMPATPQRIRAALA